MSEITLLTQPNPTHLVTQFNPNSMQPKNPHLTPENP